MHFTTKTTAHKDHTQNQDRLASAPKLLVTALAFLQHTTQNPDSFSVVLGHHSDESQVPEREPCPS